MKKVMLVLTVMAVFGFISDMAFAVKACIDHPSGTKTCFDVSDCNVINTNDLCQGCAYDCPYDCLTSPHGAANPQQRCVNVPHTIGQPIRVPIGPGEIMLFDGTNNYLAIARMSN